MKKEDTIMKKIYQTPTCSFDEFSAEDILTMSNAGERDISEVDAVGGIPFSEFFPEVFD